MLISESAVEIRGLKRLLISIRRFHAWAHIAWHGTTPKNINKDDVPYRGRRPCGRGDMSSEASRPAAGHDGALLRMRADCCPSNSLLLRACMCVAKLIIVKRAKMAL